MNTRWLLSGLLLLVASFTPATSLAAGSDTADAVQKKDIGALRALVQRKADVNVAQPDGTTALHWAVVWNNDEAVNLLLRAGADVKARNRYGATPLSEAVSSGSSAMVEALLKAGADAKTLTTDDGETVLMTAARAGNTDVVRLLLERGADVNGREKYKGQTALMWAAAERHPAVVKLLMDRGVDWRVRSFDRETKMPRLSAASAVTPLPRGGLPALSFAAREGDIESARVMLDGAVDINYGDVDNTTALIVAIMNKQYSFAKFLVDRGADVNVAGGYGRTALYALVDIRNEDYAALTGPEDRGSAADSGSLQSPARSPAELERRADDEHSRQERHGFRRCDPGRRHDAAHARRASRRRGRDSPAARKRRRLQAD